MFRSAFGIGILVLLGCGVLVTQLLRAEAIGSGVDRSREAIASGVVDTVVSRGTALLAGSELVDSCRPGVARRGFGGEPFTFLLFGVALFGAAHYARRRTRTDR